MSWVVANVSKTESYWIKMSQAYPSVQRRLIEKQSAENILAFTNFYSYQPIIRTSWGHRSSGFYFVSRCSESDLQAQSSILFNKTQYDMFIHENPRKKDINPILWFMNSKQAWKTSTRSQKQKTLCDFKALSFFMSNVWTIMMLDNPFLPS